MIKRILNIGVLLILVLAFFVNALSAQDADTSSVEWIQQVYFNMPADLSVAKERNIAHDEADLLQTLIDVLDSSKHSIDLTIYDLENLKDVDELTNLHGIGPVTMQKLRPYVTVK